MADDSGESALNFFGVVQQDSVQVVGVVFATLPRPFVYLLAFLQCEDGNMGSEPDLLSGLVLGQSPDATQHLFYNGKSFRNCVGLVPFSWVAGLFGGG